ncbi:hypothetical protein [Streptomyces californicus]
MTIMAERRARPPARVGLRATLAEEIERQERDDDARGPEAEPLCAVRVRVAGVVSGGRGRFGVAA